MRITRVYTRTGDDGSTGLAGGQRIAKDAQRLAAYGTVDELNSLIGLGLAQGLDTALEGELLGVQNDLFLLGADLCVVEEDREKFNVPHVRDLHVERLEKLIDRLQRDLPPLKEFTLPGGSVGAATLHVARSVCRRAERHAVALSHEESIPPQVIRYLNRLSDLLFVMARHENRIRGCPDVFWDKGQPTDGSPGSSPKGNG